MNSLPPDTHPGPHPVVPDISSARADIAAAVASVTGDDAEAAAQVLLTALRTVRSLDLELIDLASLCTSTGACALSIPHRRAETEATAVEMLEVALAYGLAFDAWWERGYSGASLADGWS